MRNEIPGRRAILLTAPMTLIPLMGATAKTHESQAGASLTPWFALAAVLFLLTVGLLAFRAHARRRWR